MTTREQAMNWWNSLPRYDMDKPCKELYSEKYYRRGSVNLKGREIEEIWRKETKTTEENIYLNRLKEQYIHHKKSFDLPLTSDEMFKRKDYYQAMRLFCLDTQLLSFNDIEVMENEVNQSFCAKN